VAAASLEGILWSGINLLRVWLSCCQPDEVSMLHMSPHSLGDSLVSGSPPAEVALARLMHDEVELIPQKILLSLGMPMDYIYLIQRGLVSLLRSMENGATVEVGRAGRNGVVGAEIALGSNTSRFEGVVQIGGSAVRIRARMLREELARNHVLRSYLLDRAQALLIQVSQSAACNVRHTIKRRLARWILLAGDNMGADILPISHELLSTILGNRRAGITEALGELKSAGLISNDLGRIAIRDGAGLEAVACECYEAIQGDVRQLLTVGTVPDRFETPHRLSIQPTDISPL
jgi:CRP-like cAMP-binding protein